MDDLSGLPLNNYNRNINKNNGVSSRASSDQPLQPQKSLADPNFPIFSALRPNSATPPSYPSTRTNSPAIQSKLGNAPPKPAADSFANLVSFGKNKDASVNLSLLERQKHVEADKAKAEEEKRNRLNSQFGDAKFWDVFDNKLPSSSITPPTSTPKNIPKDDDDDLFAAFNADAPVDRTSHFPPPSITRDPADNKAPEIYRTVLHGGRSGPNIGEDLLAENGPSNSDLLHDDDDDPFDLGKLISHTISIQPTLQNVDDDDFLGLLGKPVLEVPKPAPTAPYTEQHSPPMAISPPPRSDPRDGAIAEIMDMGFSTEEAKLALTKTETGLDVEQAVSWLLEEAHRKSKAVKPSTSTSGKGSSRRLPSDDDYERTDSRDGYRDGSRGHTEGDRERPAWMRESSSDRGGERDFTKIASDVGTNLFKSANSLWSQGRKKVTKAIEDFQHDKAGDDGTPKWMKDAQEHVQKPAVDRKMPLPIPSSQRNTRREVGVVVGTDEPTGPKTTNGFKPTEEALMLELGSRPQKPASRAQQKSDLPTESKNPFINRISPVQVEIALQRQRQKELESAIHRKEQEMREQECQRELKLESQPIKREKLTREVTESDVAYISPARRRKVPKAVGPPVHQHTPMRKSENLLGEFLTSSTKSQSRNPFLQMQLSQFQPESQRKQTPPQSGPSPAAPIKTKAPTRAPIHIPPSALTTSNKSRAAGTEAYKIGDYSKALAHYTSALTPIPPDHTLRILLLTNRAICHLKVGDPKSCITDTEEALSIIGAGKGEGETISLGPGESEKNMKEIWEKAMSRKAEALEQLEKWSDAHKCWAGLVESGSGGPNAIQGKRRCESALNPKPNKPASVPSSAPLHKPKPATITATINKASPKPSPSTEKVIDTSSLATAEAISRLRATNLAAEQAEAERLTLLDSVNEKIQSWKAGKEGNLRALLVSLDTILWPEAGWKKVGMHELVVANKVKVMYMRGIGKVHPDKIPTNATTEQRMICAAAFSLLNEAWDKFKVENKL